MNPRSENVTNSPFQRHSSSEGPNWMLVAGGALLSTLSVRIFCKIKQSFSPKNDPNPRPHIKGSSRRIMEPRRAPSDDDFNSISGNGILSEMKQPNHDHFLSESEVSLPLVTVPPHTVPWVSSPERMDPPPRIFHHSNCSESPCVSDAGSDIYSKREVVQKLRQQLKRRDEMILEMQDRLADLQNSLNTQMSLSSSLQSQLEATNSNLISSERELQRLRKVVADHLTTEENGYFPNSMKFKRRHGDADKIEMLKKEVADLKDVVEGKEFLVQNYKEQKNELSLKIKEMQQRLDSQLPHIL